MRYGRPRTSSISRGGESEEDLFLLCQVILRDREIWKTQGTSVVQPNVESRNVFDKETVFRGTGREPYY